MSFFGGLKIMLLMCKAWIHIQNRETQTSDISALAAHARPRWLCRHQSRSLSAALSALTSGVFLQPPHQAVPTSSHGSCTCSSLWLTPFPLLRVTVTHSSLGIVSDPTHWIKAALTGSYTFSGNHVPLLPNDLCCIYQLLN